MTPRRRPSHDLATRATMRLGLSRRQLGLALGGITAIVVTPAWAESTKDRILAGKKVTVGFVNNKPWSYRDASGTIVGIEADIIRAILGPLGVTTIEQIGRASCRERV